MYICMCTHTRIKHVFRARPTAEAPGARGRRPAQEPLHNVITCIL